MKKKKELSKHCINIVETVYYHYSQDTTNYPNVSEITQEMPCHFSCCRNEFYEEEIMEVFLNMPPLQNMQNPISIASIQQHQFMDQHLNHCHQTKPLQYPTKFVQNRPLICYRKYINDPEGIWKIALPTAIIDRVVTWYHEVLGHCGTNRLYDTIRQHFYYPNLRIKCEEYRCEICQKNKLLGAGYGHLPPRHANLVPWEEVMVDLIGPWKVKVNEQDIYFNALTCIDPVTNLVEMIRLENKTSNHVAQQFENCWLNRYPRPNKCIHDKGGEFIGPKFQGLLARA